MTVQQLAPRPHRPSVGTPALRFEDLTFESKGVRCTAWQWWPEGADGAPCVVVAYGYSGSAGHPRTAESVAGARLSQCSWEIAAGVRSWPATTPRAERRSNAMLESS
jgi:hypothetical protein